MTSVPEVTLARAQGCLERSIEGMIRRTADAERVARVGVLCPPLAPRSVPLVRDKQNRDGGWIDAEDTIWCTALLAGTETGGGSSFSDAVSWLASHRTPVGAWGRNERDQPRIPLSAIALRFIGDAIGEQADWQRIDALWSADLDAEIRLSYKGGFFLCCQDSLSDASALAKRTVEYLHSEANEDGGFGPWKDHPVGSDPWSTGVCLAGLARFPEIADRVVVGRAVDWLVSTQLPSGYWPCHFIDEGTAYAYWGLSEAVKLLDAL